MRNADESNCLPPLSLGPSHTPCAVDPYASLASAAGSCGAKGRVCPGKEQGGGERAGVCGGHVAKDKCGAKQRRFLLVSGINTFP